MLSQAQEIKKLTSAERVAAYLVRYAKLAEFFAKIYANYGDNNPSNWTEEENIYYDDLADELDPYWYALNETERKFVEIKVIPIFSSFLNGSWDNYLDKLKLLK